ncbi:MAG: type II secretion system protein GspD [Planctomycetota bacterium]
MLWGVLGLGACVTTRRPLSFFHPPGTKPLSEVKVQVFDPAGRAETQELVVGPRTRMVGKLRASPWARRPRQGGGAKQEAGAKEGGQQQEGEEAGQEPGQEPRVGDEDLYARFGPRIVIHPDRRVSKPYYVNKSTGKVLGGLLGMEVKELAGKSTPFRFGKDPKQPDKALTVLDTLLDGYELLIQVVNEFDTMDSMPIALAGKPPRWSGLSSVPVETVKNSLVLVTATADGLEAFEQAMDLFYASVPQVLIEAKVVEISSGESLDIGVSQTAKTTPTLKTRGKGGFVKDLTSIFPNANVGGTLSEGVLTLGGIHDNLELNAALELLKTRAKADIVSNPRIAVRNGGMAVIDTTTRVPYPKAKVVGITEQVSIAFENVGINMTIRPVVAPGEIVILQMSASVQAITGFADTDPIPTPEISTRSAVTTVHVPSGKTTVIGGLITKTSFRNEAQIPILGDIPILGYLFRSTLMQTESTEILFLITPRILYGFEGTEPEEEIGSGN